jgi:hypothetical protein
MDRFRDRICCVDATIKGSEDFNDREKNTSRILIDTILWGYLNFCVLKISLEIEQMIHIFIYTMEKLNNPMEISQIVGTAASLHVLHLPRLYTKGKNSSESAPIWIKRLLTDTVKKLIISSLLTRSGNRRLNS